MSGNFLIDALIDAWQESGILEEKGFVQLPKDHDGETIHIGDDIEFRIDLTEKWKVTNIALTDDGWEVDGEDPRNIVHAREDTWERIIEDAFNAATQGADERWDAEVDRDILVERCKALAGGEQ